MIWLHPKLSGWYRHSFIPAIPQPGAFLEDSFSDFGWQILQDVGTSATCHVLSIIEPGISR